MLQSAYSYDWKLTASWLHVSQATGDNESTLLFTNLTVFQDPVNPRLMTFNRKRMHGSSVKVSVEMDY